MSRDLDLVLYKKGETRTIASLNDDKTSYYTKEDYSGEDFKEMVMPFKEALEYIELALECKYNTQSWSEISEDAYYEALEVLPPKNWVNFKGGSIFASIEHNEGYYTNHYVKYNGKFYNAIRSVKIGSEELFKQCIDHIKSHTIKVGATKETFDDKVIFKNESGVEFVKTDDGWYTLKNDTLDVRISNTMKVEVIQ